MLFVGWTGMPANVGDWLICVVVFLMARSIE